ncbi:MAG: hypothetical protein ABIH68_02485 [bacterium]
MKRETTPFFRTKKSLILILWGLSGIFPVIVCEFFCPAVREMFKGSLLFLLPVIVFSLLGAALILLTVKQRVEGTLKTFLILTGATGSAILLLKKSLYGQPAE